MGMRKYERQVAHYRLATMGYTQINAPRTKDGKRVGSGFAQTWRAVLTKSTDIGKVWFKLWKHIKTR